MSIYPGRGGGMMWPMPIQRYPKAERGLLANLGLILLQGLALWPTLIILGEAMAYLHGYSQGGTGEAWRMAMRVLRWWWMVCLGSAAGITSWRLIQEIVLPLHEEERLMDKEAKIMERRRGSEEGQIAIIREKAEQDRATTQAEMLTALEYVERREGSFQPSGSSAELQSTPFISPMDLQRKAVQVLDIYYDEGYVGEKELVENRKILTRGQWEWLRKIFIVVGIILVSAKGSRKAGRLGFAGREEAIEKFMRWIIASGGGPESPSGSDSEKPCRNSSGPRASKWGLVPHQQGTELGEDDFIPR